MTIEREQGGTIGAPLPPGGTMPSNKVLHILTPVESPPEGEVLVLADCGHDCIASPATHDLLDDQRLEHEIWCLTCFMEESE